MAKFVWKPVGFCVALQGHYYVGGFFGEGSSRQSSEIRFCKSVKKKRGGGNKKKERRGKKIIRRMKPNQSAELSLYFFFPLLKLPNEADVAMQ